MRLFTVLNNVLMLVLLASGLVYGGDPAVKGVDFGKINELAHQCLAAVKSELGRFGKQHPEFKDIEQRSDIRPTPGISATLYCQMRFSHHAAFHRHILGDANDMAPAALGFTAAEANGVILMIGFSEGYVGKVETTKTFLVNLGDTKIWAYYFLELGKNYKESESPVKSIIEKHLKGFCDAVEKTK
jgi:hypothetical protein